MFVDNFAPLILFTAVGGGSFFGGITVAFVGTALTCSLTLSLTYTLTGSLGASLTYSLTAFLNATSYLGYSLTYYYNFTSPLTALMNSPNIIISSGFN